MPPERPEEDRFSTAKRSLIGRLVPKSPSAALKPVSVPEPTVEKSGAVLSVLAYLMRVAIVMCLCIAGLAAGGYAIHGQYVSDGPLPTDKVVMIKGGLSDVVEQLVQDGVVERPILLMAAIYANGISSKIKAGEYMFKQKASLEDVIGTLTEGKTILQSITIREGLTSQQIVDLLKESDILTGDISAVPPEGSLLPETYKFSRGMNRQQLLDRMMQDQARLVKELWARRVPGLPIQTPADMVVLASIVERETSKADERPRVARVFLNRLEKKMRLQSDPTFVYGLVGGKGSLGRPITRADIESNTPYNTYLIPALPPGPIANPGRAALEAVVNPSQTKDLYFVADGTGRHVFAETYEQHQRNVARWRQIENEMKESANSAPKPQPQSQPAPAAPAAAPIAAPQANIAPNQPAAAQKPQSQPATVAPAPQTTTTVTPAAKSVAPQAPTAPAPSSSTVSITSPISSSSVTPVQPAPQPSETGSGFVAPSQVPKPPNAPAGLREGSSGGTSGTQNFDLTTTKTIPKLN